MCESKKTSKATLDPKSAQEQQMNNVIMNSVIPGFMKQAGYEPDGSGGYRPTAATTESMAKKEELNKTFLEKTNKFLQGDFSVTEAQKSQIKDSLAPTKMAIDAIFGKPGNVDQNVRNVVDQARQSGMTLGSALSATGDQMRSGGTLDDALTNVISVNRELMKMGIEDATGELTKKVSQQAVMQGRDPTDPEYQKELQQNVAREVQRGQLQLSGMEAEGRMNIAQQRANAVLGLAQQESGMRFQLGGGMAPQQLGAAQSAMQYQDALRQQGLQLGGGFAQQMGTSFLQERLAQVTQTETSKDSLLGTVTGLVSAGASIFGGGGGGKDSSSKKDDKKFLGIF